MNTKRPYDVEKTAALASEYFDQGYNWAQSVLLAVSKTVGMGDGFSPRIASGMGGGIGYEGELCGALNGGVLTLGLYYGSDDPQDKDAKDRAYEHAGKYMRRFEMVNGAKRCRDLIGVNLRTEDGREAFRLLSVKERICQGVVRNAVRQVMAEIEME